MKSRIALFALTAAALTVGCRSQVAPGNNATAPANQANAAAPAPQNTAAAAPAGTPVDRAALVGRWGLDGDCANAMEFRDDGTMSDSGTWTLAGNQVTVVNPGMPPDVKPVAINGESLTIGSGAEVMNLTRCP